MLNLTINTPVRNDYRLDDNITKTKYINIYNENNIVQKMGGNTINIPDCVKDLESSAFSNCKVLKTIYIGDDIINFPTYSLFYDCNSLELFYASTGIIPNR